MIKVLSFFRNVLPAVLCLLSYQSFAANEHTRDALHALARETSICSAFFARASEVLTNALPNDTNSVAARYDTAGKVGLA